MTEPVLRENKMKKSILLLPFTLFLLGCTATPEASINSRSLVTEDCAFLDNIDDYQPVWCDEFEVDGLPASDKWGYDVGGSGWGNQELQYYTRADIDNVFVEDGILNIQAHKKSMSGRDYTSARMVSKYFLDMTYGRVQIRAKMPSGRGLWPALWMLPSEWRYGGWPDSGEIDILEYVGYQPNTIHGSIHTGAYNHSIGTQLSFDRRLETVEEAFHVYEMVWEPGRIDLYVDDILFAYFGYNPSANIDTKNTDAWPFDQPFHLIMNVAVGGTWGGVAGVDDSVFPQAMQIDYVRVYQKDFAGMDQTPPATVTNVETLKTTSTTLQLTWTKAIDDVAIKAYDIFVNGALYESTSVHGIFIDRLDPSTDYEISIISRDFKDQTSDPYTLTLTTEDGS